jgi:hypothetical protein
VIDEEATPAPRRDARSSSTTSTVSRSSCHCCECDPAPAGREKKTQAEQKCHRDPDMRWTLPPRLKGSADSISSGVSKLAFFFCALLTRTSRSFRLFVFACIQAIESIASPQVYPLVRYQNTVTLPVMIDEFRVLWYNSQRSERKVLDRRLRPGRVIVIVLGPQRAIWRQDGFLPESDAIP